MIYATILHVLVFWMPTFIMLQNIFIRFRNGTNIKTKIIPLGARMWHRAKWESRNAPFCNILNHGCLKIINARRRVYCAWSNIRFSRTTYVKSHPPRKQVFDLADEQWTLLFFNNCIMPDVCKKTGLATLKNRSTIHCTAQLNESSLNA